MIEAIIQQCDAVGKLVILFCASHHHADQTSAAAGDGFHHRVARLLRPAALTAGGALILVFVRYQHAVIGAKQTLLLLLVGGLHGIGRCAEQLGKARHRHRPLCQAGHVVGCGVVVGAVQAVGIYKMGARQAQLRGFGVHQLHKRLHAAGGVLCQHIGCVVGTGQDRGMEQIVERHDLSRLQRDMGRARLQRIDRVRADRDLLRHVAAAFFHSQRQRHNLRDTGWIIPLGAALLYEHLPRLCIHDKVCVRRHLRRHGAAFGVHRPSQTRRQRQRQDHPQQFLHLPHSSPLLSALPPKTS